MTGISSAEVRAQLSHPVIDVDGHILEFEAAVIDIIGEIAGQTVAERFKTDTYKNTTFGAYCRMWSGQFLDPQARLDQRVPRSPWWGLPTKKTDDRAAASLPGLLYERLPETGLDFSVLVPTLGLYAYSIEDEELRRAGSRACNIYNAEVVKPYADRLTSVAVIPMYTPQEAIEELEYAVRVLGMKVVSPASHVIRPLKGAPGGGMGASWIDNFCVDSIHDYDPVWAKCVELGVSPVFHTPGYGFGTRASLSNWMNNHLGAFACGAEGICRALFMGGVPHRFPSLRFGFLEGGVGWAAQLYADIIGHWTKRNRDAIRNYDPAAIDQAMLLEMHKRYGGPRVQARLDRVSKSEMKFASFSPEAVLTDPATLDEFAATGVNKVEDIKRLFVDRFYFGCEADDPMNAIAFNSRVNPMGARLKAMIGSDIGHFDVMDITTILEEAHELAEHGVITDRDLRDFVFTNPATFLTSTNPDFFKGTAVEQGVAELLRQPVVA